MYSDEFDAPTTATTSGILFNDDAGMALYTSLPVGISMSQPVAGNLDDAMQNFSRMRLTINDVVLPVIFSLGIIGNVLNAILLIRSRECISSSASSKKKRNRSDGGTGHEAYCPTTFERSAAIGLIALTSSDLAFCLFGFGRVLFTSTPADWRLWTIIGVYFSAYRGALLNLCLFTSTWMIVLVSFERYLAVCHPFRACAVVRVHRTVAAHLVVVAVSVAVNVPLFLRHTVATSCSPPRRMSINTLPSFATTAAGALSEVPYSIPLNVTQSSIDAAILYSDDVIVGNTDSRPAASCDEFYFIVSKMQPAVINLHLMVWFALGTFVPLLLIVYSNVRLILEVCSIRQHALSTDRPTTPHAIGRSRTVKRDSSLASARSNSTVTGPGNNDRAVTLRLTMTLIAIVVCFVVLVCPSMFVQFARFTIGGMVGVPGSAVGGGNSSDVRPPPTPVSSQIPFQTAIIVTDLMQAIKFSSNFLLYCVVSRSFRRTFGKLVQIQRCRQRCSYGSNKNALIQMRAECEGDRIGMSLIKQQQQQ